jgi:hypothetical protein
MRAAVGTLVSLAAALELLAAVAAAAVVVQ